MNLYLLSQDVNVDYDTFDSCVVCAENEEEAKMISPSGYIEDGEIFYDKHAWCDIEFVKVKLLGIAKAGLEKGVVCASFNAG